jgi:subtilisin family serine protease
MKFYPRWILSLTLLAGMVPAAAAQQRFIVRDTLGLTGIQATCLLLNCKSSVSLGDPSGQVFLLTLNTSLSPLQVVTNLLNQLGIVDAEVDESVSLISATAGPVPESLLDQTPLTYFATPVWDGYANQPAAQIVRVQQAQNSFNVSGAGIVAVIDTGVDTKHPALVPVLVDGYNFINNTANGDETGGLDSTHSTAAVLDGGDGPFAVNPSTIAIIGPSAGALLDQASDADFGHGTMTAGIVHLVAPTAKIMPLKAFRPDGSGHLSNIIRAIYYAGQHGSKVISMSFDFTSSSTELTNAIKYVNAKGIICVAAAGNDGVNEVVYPAGIAGVIGVASTTDYDTRSTFSSYGSDVWISAPGEGIVTTYPYGTYSAGWGTSFSTPFVAGTAALLVDVSSSVNENTAAAAVAHATYTSSSGMGNGQLDAYQAVQAWVELVQK